MALKYKIIVYVSFLVFNTFDKNYCRTTDAYSNNNFLLFKQTYINLFDISATFYQLPL